ncbi:hypothetical protein SE17_17220 [Kouleothrix aurantiaca]|jgi:ribosomal-protein-alanine N-acetyltransferase|uniref:N-acetyltransferase domain-containing protein n=1 Tax=Kouleothrix aurantiaca TaxID=186479 RepID=A0A0P9CZX4_9CHLR|nr:hypothetical protein SE17_17220 [Kouleothrix aurantiaca]
MSDSVVLYTGRFALMTLGESWAGELLDYQARNREFWREWNPLTPEDFYTVATQRARLRADAELLRQGLGLRLYILRKGAEQGPIMADLAFNNIVRGAFQSCHLGYKADAAAINQGVMTEALGAAIAYAFDELKLHRIEANVMPRNARSRRVVSKLGFAEEGLARQYLKINGVWEDHIHYVLLNDAV